jgi:F-type H+-transporting ATPase subunit b
MIPNLIYLLATEAAETATEGGLFDIDATLPLMAVQFLILAAILNALLYKPLGNAIDERADYVRNQLNQAKEQKEKSLNLAQQYEQQLKEVRRESTEIIANAQAEAKKIVSDQIQAAQQQVIAERQKASEEIAQEKAEALKSLQQQVDALSSQIIDKIIGPELAK